MALLTQGLAQLELDKDPQVGVWWPRRRKGCHGSRRWPRGRHRGRHSVGVGPKCRVEGVTLGGVQTQRKWSTWVIPRVGTQPALRRLARFCITHSRGFGRAGSGSASAKENSWDIFPAGSEPAAWSKSNGSQGTGCWRAVAEVPVVEGWWGWGIPGAGR